MAQILGLSPPDPMPRQDGGPCRWLLELFLGCMKGETWPDASGRVTSFRPSGQLKPEEERVPSYPAEAQELRISGPWLSRRA